jgi:hypothetical protein
LRTIAAGALPGLKPGETHLARVASRRLLLLGGDGRERHGDLEQALDSFALLGGDLDVHVVR